MERIYVVAVGGDGDQAVAGKYVGTDGEKAQAIFDAEGQDGSNSIVRFYHFPEHSQVRTPRRDGIPPKPKSLAARKRGEKPPPTSAVTDVNPSQPSNPEAHGDPTEDDDDETGGV